MENSAIIVHYFIYYKIIYYYLSMYYLTAIRIIKQSFLNVTLQRYIHTLLNVHIT